MKRRKKEEKKKINKKNSQKKTKRLEKKTLKKTQKFKKLKKCLKKSKNLRKTLFVKKNPIFLKINFFHKKKSSLFLNIRTRQFAQSSPVQPKSEKKIWKSLEKSKKNHISQKKQTNSE